MAETTVYWSYFYEGVGLLRMSEAYVNRKFKKRSIEHEDFVAIIKTL